MKKFLTIIGLLGLVSQPVLAQPFTANPAAIPNNAGLSQCCPTMQTNIIPPVTKGCSGLTGGAAAAMRNDANSLPVPDTLQAVPIRRPFLLNRTGYIPVCPAPTCPSSVTGGAASVAPAGCPVMRPMFIPKERWWEKNEYKMVPVQQTSSCCPVPACPVCPPAGAAAPVTCPAPIIKVSPAAPVRKKPVRGYW